MGYDKGHQEFTGVDMKEGFHEVPGYPWGFTEKILAGSLDEKNQVVARLGDDVARVTSDNFTIRGDKSKWQDGKFVHPHDACFDRDGSIFVAEWVGTGRISKLKRLS